jgi:hypothetical protein
MSRVAKLQLLFSVQEERPPVLIDMFGRVSLNPIRQMPVEYRSGPSLANAEGMRARLIYLTLLYIPRAPAVAELRPGPYFKSDQEHLLLGLFQFIICK